MKSYHQPRAQWRSFSSYVLVTTGAIVGLGNILYFPFLVIKFGGLFILFYVASELLISIPLLFADLFIGRRGKQNPVGSLSIVSMEVDASQKWRMIGWLCFIILFLTLSFYTISVAYPLGYLFGTIHDLFSQGHTIDLSTTPYTNLTSSFWSLEICFLVFIIFTLTVIVRGINRGLETISMITVPVYFVLLLIIAIIVSFHGFFFDTLHQLIYVPANTSVWLVFVAALTFAFFKLNVGMGSMIVYGSYLPYHVPLGKSTAIIVILDAIISLLSYFIICPLVLESNVVNLSSALSYQNIILIFSAIPFGLILAIFFFLSVVLAAWTVTIAIAESAAITLIERFQISRLRATILLFIGTIILGTIEVLSNTTWSHLIIMKHWNIASLIETFATHICVPIAAFFIAIFCGWIVSRSISYEELGFNNAMYAFWRFLVRYLAPISALAILVIMSSG